MSDEKSTTSSSSSPPQPAAPETATEEHSRPSASTSSADAQMTSTAIKVTAPAATAAAAAQQIEIIAEEEEEEEEEEEGQQQEEDEEEKKKRQHPKFVLEPVTLDKDPLVQQQQQQQQQLQQLEHPSPSKSITSTASSTAQEQRALQQSPTPDVAEIKVEEGYATRQMDEYFRQTIAAIKEELEKKLETQQQQQLPPAPLQHTALDLYDDDWGDDEDLDDLDDLDSFMGTAGDDDQDLMMDDVAAAADIAAGVSTIVDDMQQQQQQAAAQFQSTTDCCTCCGVGGGGGGGAVSSAEPSATAASCPTHPHSGGGGGGRTLHRYMLYQHMLATASRQAANKGGLAGWLVVLGCFINQFIVEGFLYNYSALLNRLEDRFRESTGGASSKLLATLPATLLLAFYLLFAPLALYLAKTYGSRCVAIVGSLISAAALVVLSLFFTTNVALFSFFYGILNGIGLSMVYIPSVVSLGRWFIKKRLFANNLAIAGAGLGACLYPLLSEFLLTRYELSGTLLILSGLQLNCLVGSMLLRERYYSPFFQRISTSKPTKKVASATKATKRGGGIDDDNEQLLLESNERTPNKVSNKAAFSTPTTVNNKNQQVPVRTNNMQQQQQQQQQQTTPQHRFRGAAVGGGLRKPDGDNESTASTSTTPANYTLKQHWRKFLQTRKTPANAKKNLFHLIAEEKRKTRTMSKSSLEDGFVITTSNNLLAPNANDVVVISARQRKQWLQQRQQQQQQQQEQMSQVSHKMGASRIFSRIAHSLRSLTTGGGGGGGGGSVSGTTSILTASRNHLLPQQQHQQQQAQTSAQDTSETSETIALSQQTAPTPLKTATAAAAPKSGGEQQALPLTLMNVFSPPTTEEQQQQQQQNTSSTDHQVPPQLASVFDPQQQQPNNGNSMSTLNALSDNNANNGVSSTAVAPATNSEADSAAATASLAGSAGVKGAAFNAQAAGYVNTNRYRSYRNSLTNSIRGSLFEYSVPENPAEEELVSQGEGGDTTSVGADDHYKRFQQRAHRARLIKQRMLLAAAAAGGGAPFNSTASNPNERIHAAVSAAGGAEQRSRATAAATALLSKKLTLMNIRRLISITECSSFYNAPLNLESAEQNQRNSLVKKRQQPTRQHQQQQQHHHEIMFLDYLSYLSSCKLFCHPVLLVLNASFFLTVLGICVSLVYVCQFGMQQGLNKSQGIYVLSFIGLCSAFGRIMSTVIYKANDSNAKSRIFAYNLSLILMGMCVGLCPFLCDTPFSFAMFAITYGLLLGFNSNLRSLFVYDMMGLEWNDDSLFCCLVVLQSFGVCFGLPIAGLFMDVFDNYSYVFHLSGVCMTLAGFMLIPGRQFRVHFKSSNANFNKLYLQKNYN